MPEREFFRVCTEAYCPGTAYWVTRPASIHNPKDHAVMFITRGYPEYRTVFESVSGCLIFWPKEWEIPERISVGNAVVSCENPHLAYCQFYQEQKITGLYQPDKTVVRDSSLIAMTALIGEGTVIFPGCYIGGQVSIGRNCFIGAGVKIVGHVQIGDNVWIRENTVIGTDGMSTDRDENGHPVTMPQFGGVIIEDDVQIGANACILRGAIDDTVLHRGCKIDSLVLVSHNVSVGEESFVIAVTHLFGSSTVGRRAQVSGGCVVGNYVRIGDGALLGMGSVAPRNIPDGWIAYGSPAKPMRERDM